MTRAALAALLLASCGAEPADKTAAPTPEPTRAAPSSSPTSIATRDVLSEGPIEPGSAQDAANTVQSFYALVETRRYAQAAKLWNPAAGLTAAALEAQLAPYAEYHAEVLGPGPVDAGAGQRFVTVPVRPYGVLKSGKSFRRAGEVVLHRVADGIDAPDPDAHRWRIRSAPDVTP